VREKEGYRRHRRGWQLNERQRRVLDALVEGRTNAEIAVRLGITVDGAKWHVGELLAQTGLSDRQALARWWVEEREKRRQPAFLPGLIRWRRIGLAGSVVVAAAVLVTGGWLLWGRGSGREAPQPAAGQASLDEGFISGGGIKPSKPLFEDFLVELTVELPPRGSSRVDLRDITTGQKLASVEAGYRPMVVVRKHAQEILVSSVLNIREWNEGEEPRQVLEVYNLRGYSLAHKRAIELPDRVNCTTYCQPMVLSNDERYLYYSAVVTAPECGAGGDASVCDIHSVVAVDLEDEGAGRVSTELPRGCGVPRMSPAGPSGVLVTCAGQYPVNGGWTRLIQPDGGGRTIDFSTSRPMFSFVTSEGEIVVLKEDGNLIKESPDGLRVSAEALPTGLDFIPRVFYLGTVSLGDGRLFIVFDDSYFGEDRKYGFVVFDLRKMTQEGYGRVPQADYYLPQGESVFVLRGGRIEVLDLASGRLSVLTDSVEPGVEVLLPGR